MQNLYKQNSKSGYFTIHLKVKAGAKTDSIHEFVDLGEAMALKISVKTPPEDGKANIAIIKLLSKNWKIPRDDLEIIQGATSSAKVLEIKNITEESLKEIFSTYIPN